jgi:hypothetical protein
LPPTLWLKICFDQISDEVVRLHLKLVWKMRHITPHIFGFIPCSEDNEVLVKKNKRLYELLVGSRERKDQTFFYQVRLVHILDRNDL